LYFFNLLSYFQLKEKIHTVIKEIGYKLKQEIKANNLFTEKTDEIISYVSVLVNVLFSVLIGHYSNTFVMIKKALCKKQQVLVKCNCRKLQKKCLDCKCVHAQQSCTEACHQNEDAECINPFNKKENS